MTSKSNLRWHHDFPRLVRKLGFKFITDKPKVLIDWSSIALVDTNDIVQNRNIGALEQHINDVIYYSLQDDAHILDKKFVKLFRLAQLTIEYLLFCLHYLDQGVIQLQTHICEKEQENEDLRSELVHQEKAASKYKKKLNDLHMFFSPQMGVVNMSNMSSEIFRCPECEKQFISEEFLKAHQKRRHTKTDAAKSSQCVESVNTEKIISEIQELKEKITQVEREHNEEKLSENDSITNVLMTLLRQNSSVLSTKVSKTFSTEAFTLTEPNDVVMDELANAVVKIPSIDNGVQCNLISTEDNKENHMEMVRNELKKWKEKETSEILSQLENLKKKVYTDLEQIKVPPVIPKKREIDLDKKTQISSFKIIETNLHTPTLRKNPEFNSKNQLEKLEHKLENNVDRLFKQLTQQEQEWRKKIQELEQKSTPKPNREKETETNNLNQNSIVEPPKKIDKLKNSNLQHKTHIPISTNPKGNSPLMKKSNLPRVHFNSKPQISVNTSLNKSLDYSSSTTSSPLVSPKANIKSHKSKSNQRKNTKKEAPILITSTIGDAGTNQTEVSNVNISMKHSQSTIGKHSVSSLKEAIFCDPHFLSEFKQTMLGLVQSSLRDIGVDPEWKRIPKPMLEKHISTMNHVQTAVVEKHPDYYQIKNEIANEIDFAVKKEMVVWRPNSAKPSKPGFPPFSGKRRSMEMRKSRSTPVAIKNDPITIMELAAQEESNPILSEINSTVQKMKNKVASVFTNGKNEQMDHNVNPTRHVTEGIYKLKIIKEDNSPKKPQEDNQSKKKNEQSSKNVRTKELMHNCDNIKNASLRSREVSIDTLQPEMQSKNPLISKNQILADSHFSTEKIEKLVSSLTPNDSMKSSFKTHSNIKESDARVLFFEQTESSSSDSKTRHSPRNESQTPIATMPSNSPLPHLNISAVSSSQSNSLSPESPTRRTTSKSLSPPKGRSMYEGGEVTDTDSSKKTNSNITKQTQNDFIMMQSQPKVVSSNYSSPSSPEMVVALNKKKVFFDLQSENTSLFSKIEKSLISSKFSEAAKLSPGKKHFKSNSNTPSSLNRHSSLNKTAQSASVFVKSSSPRAQRVVDNGDTTSISSSVFDGSKINLETEQKNDTKNEKRSNEIEELILSDFEYSSGDGET